ncbi:uncharacterized protein BO96DRAFT_429331 [Aspergillus niger CBS 101883]|nr:uncharacterized protein BO96DRAFT_429331 [Aspergillus niger CBS 101883]PYH62817.1 hypothetical protein BO96DRAFT_429331 [Aspergillus niger CBS 101883]
MEKNEPVGGVSVCELNPELNLYPLGTCGEQSRDSVKAEQAAVGVAVAQGQLNLRPGEREDFRSYLGAPCSFILLTGRTAWMGAVRPNLGTTADKDGGRRGSLWDCTTDLRRISCRDSAVLGGNKVVLARSTDDQPGTLTVSIGSSKVYGDKDVAALLGSSLVGFPKMTTNHHRHHQQETTSPGNVPSHRHLTHLTSTTKCQFYSNVPSYPSLVITQPTTLSPLIGSIPTNTHGSTPVPENLDLLAETDWYDYGGHYFCFLSTELLDAASCRKPARLARPHTTYCTHTGKDSAGGETLAAVSVYGWLDSGTDGMGEENFFWLALGIDGVGFVSGSVGCVMLHFRDTTSADCAGIIRSVCVTSCGGLSVVVLYFESAYNALATSCMLLLFHLEFTWELEDSKQRLALALAWKYGNMPACRNRPNGGK